MNSIKSVFLPIFVTIVILLVTIFSYVELQSGSKQTEGVNESYATNLLILDNLKKEINHLKTTVTNTQFSGNIPINNFKIFQEKINESKDRIKIIFNSNKIQDEKFLNELKQLINNLSNNISSSDKIIQNNDPKEIILLLWEIDNVINNIDILIDEKNKNLKRNFLELQKLSHEKYSYANQLLTMVIVINIILTIVMSFWMYKIITLRKQDTQKTEFASMITHELKTPLSPIITACEMLDEEILGTLNDSQKEEIQRIQRNASSLLKIIIDILDVQKLGMEKLTFTNKEFNIIELFDELISDYKEIMNERKIKLNVNVNEKTSIISDKNRLRQVISNLIKNSLDFVKDNSGIIDMGTYFENENIVFFVKDNGQGIKNEKQSELFKKFYQVDTSLTRKHGGTGLGLSICKGIVEALDGKIWLKSQIGTGTEVFFSIPIKPTTNKNLN